MHHICSTSELLPALKTLISSRVDKKHLWIRQMVVSTFAGETRPPRGGLSGHTLPAACQTTWAS